MDCIANVIMTACCHNIRNSLFKLQMTWH